VLAGPSAGLLPHPDRARHAQGEMHRAVVGEATRLGEGVIIGRSRVGQRRVATAGVVRRAKLIVGSPICATHDAVTGRGPHPVHGVPGMDGEVRGSERQAILSHHDGVGLRGDRRRGRQAARHGRRSADRAAASAASIATARDALHAACASLRRRAFSGVRLDRALRDALRGRPTAGNEAGPAAGRLGGAMDDGAPALLRQASARHRRLRRHDSTLDVLPVTRRRRAGALRVNHGACGSDDGGVGARSVSHARREQQDACDRKEALREVYP